MKILTIIPAKLDSKRLPQKNIQEINGKSLVEYSIDYAKQSKHDPLIILSSESATIEDIAQQNEVQFLLRDKSMCGDVEVVDVYIEVLNQLNEKFDLVVALQPDHPDRQHSFDYCVAYMLENGYDDLIAVEPSYKRSGSVRVFKYEHLMNGHVSKRIGTICDDATDIHYLEDLERAKQRIYRGIE